MKYILPLILIFSVLIFSEKEPVQMGDHFFDLDKYQAVTEYHRSLLFDGEYPHILQKIAICERELGNFEMSNSALYRALRLDNNTYFHIMIASNFIAMGEYTKAELTLERLSEERTKDFKDTMDFQKMLIYISTKREKEALRMLNSIYPDAYDKEIAENIIKLTKKRVNPVQMKIHSMLIPGSGQIGSGQFINGLNAFFLNGAIFYLWYSILSSQKYLSLVLYIMSLNRYYFGNIDNALNFAELRNQNIDKEIIFIFIEYLRSIQ